MRAATARDREVRYDREAKPGVATLRPIQQRYAVARVREAIGLLAPAAVGGSNG